MIDSQTDITESAEHMPIPDLFGNPVQQIIFEELYLAVISERTLGRLVYSRLGRYAEYISPQFANYKSMFAVTVVAAGVATVLVEEYRRHFQQTNGWQIVVNSFATGFVSALITMVGTGIYNTGYNRLVIKPFKNRLKQELIKLAEEAGGGDSNVVRIANDSIDTLFRSAEQLGSTTFWQFSWMVAVLVVLNLIFVNIDIPVDNVVDLIDQTVAEVISLVSPDSPVVTELRDAVAIGDIPLTYVDHGEVPSDHHKVKNVNVLGHDVDNLSSRLELGNDPTALESNYRVYRDNFVHGMILTYLNEGGVYGFVVRDLHGETISPENFVLYYYPYAGIYAVEYRGDVDSLSGHWVIEWYTSLAMGRGAYRSVDNQQLKLSNEDAEKILDLVEQHFGYLPDTDALNDSLSKSRYSLDPAVNPLHEVQFTISDPVSYVEQVLSQAATSCYPAAAMSAIYASAYYISNLGDNPTLDEIAYANQLLTVATGYLTDTDRQISSTDRHAWNLSGDFTPSYITEDDQYTRDALAASGETSSLTSTVVEVSITSFLSDLYGKLLPTIPTIAGGLAIASLSIGTILFIRKYYKKIDSPQMAQFEVDEPSSIIKILGKLRGLEMFDSEDVQPPEMQTDRIREILDSLADADLGGEGKITSQSVDNDSAKFVELIIYLVMSIPKPEKILQLTEKEEKIYDQLLCMILSRLDAHHRQFAPQEA